MKLKRMAVKPIRVSQAARLPSQPLVVMSLLIGNVYLELIRFSKL